MDFISLRMPSTSSSFGNSVSYQRYGFSKFFVNKSSFSSWLTETGTSSPCLVSTDEIRNSAACWSTPEKSLKPWNQVRLLPIHAHASRSKVTEGSRRGRETKSSSGETSSCLRTRDGGPSWGRANVAPWGRQVLKVFWLILGGDGWLLHFALPATAVHLWKVEVWKHLFSRLGTRRIPRCWFDALQKFQLRLLRRNVATDTSGLENSWRVCYKVHIRLSVTSKPNAFMPRKLTLPCIWNTEHDCFAKVCKWNHDTFGSTASRKRSTHRPFEGTDWSTIEHGELSTDKVNHELRFQSQHNVALRSVVKVRIWAYKVACIFPTEPCACLPTNWWRSPRKSTDLSLWPSWASCFKAGSGSDCKIPKVPSCLPRQNVSTPLGHRTDCPFCGTTTESARPLNTSTTFNKVICGSPGLSPMNE